MPASTRLTNLTKPRSHPLPSQACNFFKWADELGSSGGASPAAKRRVTNYSSGAAGAGSQGGYQPGWGGYGADGGAAPPVPGTNTFQAAADGGALRDRSNDTCYK